MPTFRMYIMTRFRYVLLIGVAVMLTQCSKEEEQLTEWGEKTKAELEELNTTISDLAWLKVYNADESEMFWSGVGTPEVGSPVLMWTIMEKFLGVEYQVFDLETNDWNISRIELPYNDIIGVILQYASFYDGGILVRKAHGVLIYMSNDYVPDDYVDGVEAKAAQPDGSQVVLEKVILSR